MYFVFDLIYRFEFLKNIPASWQLIAFIFLVIKIINWIGCIGRLQQLLKKTNIVFMYYSDRSTLRAEKGIGLNANYNF